MKRQLNSWISVLAGSAMAAVMLIQMMTVEHVQATSSLPSTAVQAAPVIVVTTTADVMDFGALQQVGNLPGTDGLVSLREAITAANNSPGPQVIAFNIPTTDPGFDGKVFTIRVGLPGLPELTDDGTTIDGTTQTTITGHTNPDGPEIVLDGTSAEDSAGIAIGHSSYHVIRGLVIHSFAQAGIQFNLWQGHDGGPNHNRIVGCYIGTDETGSLTKGNGWQGIAIDGSYNIIGGPDPEDGTHRR
jgi:hypothetical protein